MDVDRIGTTKGQIRIEVFSSRRVDTLQDCCLRLCSSLDICGQPYDKKTVSQDAADTIASILVHKDVFRYHGHSDTMVSVFLVSGPAQLQ